MQQAADFIKSPEKTQPEIRYFYSEALQEKKGKPVDFPFSKNLERETSLELATSTLARLRSTN